MDTTQRQQEKEIRKLSRKCNDLSGKLMKVEQARRCNWELHNRLVADLMQAQRDLVAAQNALHSGKGGPA